MKRKWKPIRILYWLHGELAGRQFDGRDMLLRHHVALWVVRKALDWTQRHHVRVSSP
jgi:hypothetical protein